MKRIIYFLIHLRVRFGGREGGGLIPRGLSPIRQSRLDDGAPRKQGLGLALGFSTHLLVALIAISTVSVANGRSDTKLSKNITRSFKLNHGADLDIVNKYGKVIINTWNKDSVKFSIDIVVQGKNDEVLERLMSRVDIEFNHTADFMTVETVMEKRTGSTFSNVLSSIEDYSKSFLSKNKITIDYVVNAPRSINLDLENRFGDVFISDFQGRLDLVVAHGDLKARTLRGKCEINLSFGRAKVKNIGDAFFRLKGVELDVDNGHKLSIESSSSEFSIMEARMVKINSRNDKIKIRKVELLSGNGDFSDVYLGELIGGLDLDLDYGEVFIDKIDKDFNKIAINSKAADINLILSPESYFRANIRGSEDRMIVPNSMLSLKKIGMDEKEGTLALEGLVGNTRSKVGVVNINANDADLIISIKETPIFTDRD